MTLKRIFCNDQMMLLAILLNTIIIFIGGFWPDNICFELLDACFTLFFVCEAIVKISTYGWKSYWSEAWNRFDFIILIIVLPTLADPFLEQSLAMNALLALRCVRIFKSFKMLRFIPNIHNLLNGMKLAFKTSFIVIIAFVVLLVIFSILSCAVFGKIAPDYFGNPGISLYSIFRLFTIEGWYEMPDTIAANGGDGWGLFARLYFSALLFIGGIIGMSLINSVFVDAMTANNNDDVLEKLDRLERKIDQVTERMGKEE